MIKPKEIEIDSIDGDTKKYRISKIPAIPARAIVAKYILGGIPKVGDYDQNHEQMLNMMKYVEAPSGDGWIALETESQVNNHVPDFETLMRIEFQMLTYNTSFFQKGKISTFSKKLMSKVESLGSSMLTDSLEKLLQANEQASKNSEPSTH